jgi:hypothetical protein
MFCRSDSELIADLHKVLQLHGKLTVKAIRATPGVISPWVYWERFGSMAKAYEAAGYQASRGYFAGCSTRKNTTELKAQMLVDLTILLRNSGRQVRIIPRGISIRGLGRLGIETAQWIRVARGKLRWEVRTGPHKRYRHMIVGRISPDRRSILDFVYISAVPKTKCNFRLTDEMLGKEPRGSLDHIGAVVVAQCV